MSRPSRLAIAAVVLTVFALASGPARAQVARFEALPIHPTGSDAAAYGVSRDGSTVVGQGSTAPAPTPPAPTPREALAWRDGQLTALGDLPGDDPNSLARAASADGGVIVGAGNYFTTNTTTGAVTSANRQAVRWVNGTLSTLSGPTQFQPMEAMAVSADGSVIVGYGTPQPGAPVNTQAFRWAGGVATPLVALPNTDSTRASGVSADGSVVVGDGFSTTGNGNNYAFRWENGAMTALQPAPGLSIPSATAISGDGRVIIGYAFSSSLGGSQPYRWENGVMEPLSGLGTGGFAEAVSGDGSVIVGEAETGTSTAFIWDAAHGMRSLQDLLQNQYGVDLTGWKLLQASGISDDGRTIVGWGTNPAGATQAFRVVLPEPGGLFIFIPCAAAALKRRRRA
jgi:probable HAF family extracellular repeat protein